MINKLLAIFFLSFIYSQWAMWANPSLPVGNSDRGVGLGAGEIMVFADYSYQYFDWWHAKVNQDNLDPNAFLPGTDIPEDFEHWGLMKNNVLNFGITIGLNDYWNISCF